ncbi:Uncharacterised protein [Candidatus Anstonella stagnisolia]|nr:Uncharacterised protein [Candidatus Anstonella stagnisolia]
MKPERKIPQAETIVRAQVARHLVLGKHMKQVQVCELMGITQPAISQYISGARGFLASKPHLSMINRSVRKLANNIKKGKLKKPLNAEIKRISERLKW